LQKPSGGGRLSVGVCYDRIIEQGGAFMEYTYPYPSPLGGITLASDGTALTGLWFDGQAHFASTLPAEHEERTLPVFRQAEQWLDVYFSGRAPDFTPPLHLRGTPFQRAVWDLLLEIPFGRTVTYGELAARLAKQRGADRMSARAVGAAVGRNPISLIVPCHRVVGAGGRLTGYAGGLDKKARLLALEGIAR